LQRVLARLLEESKYLNLQLIQLQKMDPKRLRYNVELDYLTKRARELASKVNNKRDSYEVLLKRINTTIVNIHYIKLAKFSNKTVSHNILIKLIEQNTNDIHVMLQNLHNIQNVITPAAVIEDQEQVIEGDQEQVIEGDQEQVIEGDQEQVIEENQEQTEKQEQQEQTTEENRSRFFNLFDKILIFVKKN
jgi:hypothetical protein